MLSINGTDYDGTTIGGCKFTLMYEGIDFPEPPLKQEADAGSTNDPDSRKWDFDEHGPATCSLKWMLEGTTSAAVAAGRNRLIRDARKGATLAYAAYEGAEALERTILAAQPSTSAANGYSEPVLYVSLTLRTTPYWLGPETGEQSITLPSLPAVVDVLDVKGEVPALTKVQVVPSQATSMIAVGLRSFPSSTGDALSATATTSHTEAITGRTTGIPDITSKFIRLTLKVPDITHCAFLKFYFGSNDFADSYCWEFFTQGANNYIVSDQWLDVTLPFGDVTATTGTPARNTLQCWKLEVRNDATEATSTTVYLADIKLEDDGRAQYANGVCVVTYDDSNSSPLTQGAFTKCEDNDILATIYTIVETLGTAGKLTLAQLNTQKALGWEIGGHAYTSTVHNSSFTGVDSSALGTELYNLRTWMDGEGFTSRSLAYPLGHFGLTSDAVNTTDIVRYYFDNARTTNGGPASNGVMKANRETSPVGDPYRIRCISNISSYSGGAHVSPDDIINTVIPAVAANGGQLWLSFHNIIAAGATPSSADQCTITDHDAIIDAAVAAGFTFLTATDATTLPVADDGPFSFPVVSFYPTQDYNASPDTSRTAVGYTAQTMGADYAGTISTPTTLPLPTNEGRYRLLARVQNGATTGATSLAFLSSLGTDTVRGSDTACTLDSDEGYEVLDLGPADVPCGHVPTSGTASTSWGPVGVKKSYTAGTTLDTSGSNARTTQDVVFTEVVLVTEALFKVKRVLPTSTAASVTFAGITANMTIPGNTDGWVKAYLPPTVLGPDAGYPVISVDPDGNVQFYGSDATGGSIDYQVRGRSVQTFAPNLGVVTKCVGQASQNVRLDWTAAVPVDEAAVKVVSTRSADEGVCIDNLAVQGKDRDVYPATVAGGVTATSLILSTTPYGGPLMFRPGNNKLVLADACLATSVPASVTLSVTHRPRYLTPTRGE